MLISSLFDYVDVYKLAKGTSADTSVAGAPAYNVNKEVTFKNCALFCNYLNRIKNTQVHDGHHTDVVMSTCNFIEYSNKDLKTSVVFEDAFEANDAITDFNEASATTSFNLKPKITDQTGNVKQKYWINGTTKICKYFLRTFEMPLINCEINLDLNWSKICIIVVTNLIVETNVANQAAITDTTLYVPVVNLST